MLPLTNTLEHCFNTNVTKPKTTINRKTKRLNPNSLNHNHRVCQGSERATINLKKPICNINDLLA